MTTHGALFGAVPYLIRMGVPIAVLTFLGWKIANWPGALVSLLTGVSIAVGMAIAPTVNDKATVAGWCIGAGITGMLICDFLPTSRVRRRRHRR